MEPMSFEVTLGRSDASKSGAFIQLPFDVEAVFGKAKPKVLVTINDHTYRSTVAVYSGDCVHPAPAACGRTGPPRSYLLPVNAQNAKAAGVQAGDTVTVTIAEDTAPRVVEPPDDLAEALQPVREQWDALSYSHQREYATWVEDAKKPETRARRIAQTVEKLRPVGGNSA
jgi:hypothetical protein